MEFKWVDLTVIVLYLFAKCESIHHMKHNSANNKTSNTHNLLRDYNLPPKNSPINLFQKLNKTISHIENNDIRSRSLDTDLEGKLVTRFTTLI